MKTRYRAPSQADVDRDIHEVEQQILISRSASELAGDGRYLQLTGGTLSGPLEIEDNLVLPKTAGTGIQLDTDSPAFGWRDIIGRVSPKATGAGAPSRKAYAGANVGQYAFVANDVIDMEFHIPHDWVPGSDIFFHVHWSHNGTAISGNVVFTIYHTIAAGFDQAAFAAEKTQTITYNTTNIATTPQYRHRVDEVAISGSTATSAIFANSDIEVDGLWLVTLKVTTLPSITGGDLFIHTCDLHYQSNNMATINKAPSFYG